MKKFINVVFAVFLAIAISASIAPAADRENFYVTNLTVDKILNTGGNDITPMANPSGGRDFFVDGNKAVAGNGLSWPKAFKTLAVAIAASDTYMADSRNRAWAKRNRIFVVGDVLTENLVKFPTKCDVIGVGSYDGNVKPGISGRHLPVGEAYGTRFYNIHWKALAHASPIITLTNAASGVQFIGNTFDGTLGTMTSAILATASPFLEVRDSDFVGTFVTSYITFGAGQAGRARIINNQMLGTAAKGIVVPGTTTASWAPLIKGNTILATGKPIEDASGLFHVVNNRLMTAINIGTTTDGYSFTLALSSGNILTGLNGVAATVPFAVTAE
jgi:hypothetical protein